MRAGYSPTLGKACTFFVGCTVHRKKSEAIANAGKAAQFGKANVKWCRSFTVVNQSATLCVLILKNGSKRKVRFRFTEL
jgi:hypothetical protein